MNNGHILSDGRLVKGSMVSPSRTKEFHCEQYTQDTHNSNLVRWKRPVSPLCLLCGGLQPLRHILNGCKQVLRERQYNQRQDEVLREIVTFLGQHLSAINYQ